MKKLAFYFLITLIFCQASAADNGWLEQVKQKYQDFWQTRKPEKLFLHLDRTFYSSSDTIWFKAYLTDVQTGTLHNGPEVVYINIFSPENSSVLSQKLITKNGLGVGNIVLPDSLKDGSYLLQANTNWQRNTGSGSFFKQLISINTIAASAKTEINGTQKVVKELQFYPEGGRLIAGFENKVAFKALSNDGLEIPVEGKITDETGKVIVSFRSLKGGIGSFSFKPITNKKYAAQLVSANSKQAFSFPPISKGYGLSVKNYRDSVQVIIAASPENLKNKIYLTLKSEQGLYLSASITLNANRTNTHTFLTKNWPIGIIQATIFNSQGIVENERSFLHQGSPLFVKLSTNKKVFTRREPVQVILEAKDAKGQPLEAELSVAVVSDYGQFQPSLRNSLLFASALPGLQAKADSTFRDLEVLDNVLLTSELEGDFWTDSLLEQPSQKFVQETEFNTFGLVSDNNVALAKAIIYLLDTKTHNTYLAIADTAGKFSIPSNNVSQYFYQVWQNGIFKKNAQLQLLATETIFPPKDWKQLIEQDSVATNKLKMRNKIERIYNPNSITTSSFKPNAELWPVYKADKYYPLEEYNDFNTMEEIFREIIPSVRIVSENGQTNANIYNVERRDFYPYQPLYVIDGQPTWNSDIFLRLDASQLKQINVYYSSKNLQYFGFLGSNGVIAVFTKSGNYRNTDLKTENLLNIPGQNSNSQFEAKNFSADVPDFRPTLYWNPKVQTNAEGKATINFRTSDEMGNLRVQVEGITKDGKLISEQLLIPVQPAE